MIETIWKHRYRIRNSKQYAQRYIYPIYFNNSEEFASEVIEEIRILDFLDVFNEASIICVGLFLKADIFTHTVLYMLLRRYYNYYVNGRMVICSWHISQYTWMFLQFFMLLMFLAGLILQIFVLPCSFLSDIWTFWVESLRVRVSTSYQIRVIWVVYWVITIVPFLLLYLWHRLIMPPQSQKGWMPSPPEWRTSS